jgi:hypothetical protein
MTQLADYRHRAPDSFRGPRGDYNGPGNGQDFATSVTVSQATGTVFVTGQATGSAPASTTPRSPTAAEPTFRYMATAFRS